jgi:hypothetical protein
LKTRYITYGKTVKTDNTTTERLEISVEVHGEYEEEVVSFAKNFVRKHLNEKLTATIGEHLASKGK